MLQGYYKAAIRSYEFRGVSQGESSGAFLFLPGLMGMEDVFRAELKELPKAPLRP